MGHRPSLIATVAVTLWGCTVPSADNAASPPADGAESEGLQDSVLSPSTPADTATNATVIVSDYHPYVFELDIDGQASSFTTYALGVVESFGSACDTRWVVTANGGVDETTTLLLQLYSELPPTAGTMGQVGELTADNRGTVAYFDEFDQFLGELHAPFEITSIGIDALEVSFTGGTHCTDSAMEPAACPSFQQATLRLTPGEGSFEPTTLYCCEDDWTDQGECKGRTIGTGRDVELCP